MRSRNCLPAICQVAPDELGFSSACGNRAAPDRHVRLTLDRQREHPRQDDLAADRQPGNVIKMHCSCSFIEERHPAYAKTAHTSAIIGNNAPNSKQGPAEASRPGRSKLTAFAVARVVLDRRGVEQGLARLHAGEGDRSRW